MMIEPETVEFVQNVTCSIWRMNFTLSLNIRSYFTARPNVYKLTQLLSTTNKQTLCNAQSQRTATESIGINQTHSSIFDHSLYVFIYACLCC